jgi:hypothetical protein
MLARLETFAHGGGKVLFLGGAPTLISDRTIRNSAMAAPADFSWATVVNVGLSSTPTPPATPPAMPPQPQVIPFEVLAALNAAVVAPAIKPETPTTSLRVMKRRWKDADVYLFFNESADMWDHGVFLMSNGNTAETWDPQTGIIAPLQSKRVGGSLAVGLPLQPFQTRAIVVR